MRDGLTGGRLRRALRMRGYGSGGGRNVPVSLRANHGKQSAHEHQRREGSLTVLCLVEDMAGDGLSTCTGGGAGGGSHRRCSGGLELIDRWLGEFRGRARKLRVGTIGRWRRVELQLLGDGARSGNGGLSSSLRLGSKWRGGSEGICPVVLKEGREGVCACVLLLRGARQWIGEGRR